MNLQKRSVIFFAIFLISVINKHSTDAFIEFYNHPIGSLSVLDQAIDYAADKYTLTTGDDFYEELSTSESKKTYSKKTHEAINITMRVLTTVTKIVNKRIWNRNIQSKRPPPHLSNAGRLWHIKLSIDAEVQEIEGKLKNTVEPVDNTYRLKKTASLTAIIFTKWLAYYRGITLLAKLDERSSTKSVSQQKALVAWYLLNYAAEINSTYIIDVLIMLVRGTTFEGLYNRNLESKLEKMRMSLTMLDTQSEYFILKANEGESYNDVALDAAPYDNMNVDCIWMLYKSDTIDFRKCKDNWFTEHITAAYKRICDEIDEDIETIENIEKRDGIVPLEILRHMEIKMAEEFQLYGPMREEDKEEMNKGEGPELIMNYTENEAVLV